MVLYDQLPDTSLTVNKARVSIKNILNSYPEIKMHSFNIR